MSLKSKLKDDLKASMKNHDEVSMAVLRLLNADIKNKEIELIRELSDDEIVKIIKTNLKKRKDSIELYNKGNRKDLAEKEEGEITVLSKYLPSDMSEDELRKMVVEELDKMGSVKVEDFGNIMKKIMTISKGRADGKLVSDIVRNEIACRNKND